MTSIRFLASPKSFVAVIDDCYRASAEGRARYGRGELFGDANIRSVQWDRGW
jgi:hypothetical protein